MIGSIQTGFTIRIANSLILSLVTTTNIMFCSFFQDCVLRNLLLKVKDAAKNVVSIISLRNFLQEYYHNIEVSSGGAV